ncbi:Sulfite reductase [NADPH] hemoprotein beta-component [Candidatus Phaeomarinobacter ectocarpi]|uniref:Sulfite reductase [NADPH] hemoprotein beta-component n=1 Tax=Candidatus Phaeomarinibacter ectocarpi TaxID=1458461 RepID=X5MA79_9HYPH|nr:nitrite/sulfite reductase [Candidatus Phaeomarinobacter ectocarpi]CDO60668.1 Sulfite reductase [NADPH] hemoprotein beta-component [Candidatus Phaeomarinobacter ectocarpi]
MYRYDEFDHTIVKERVTEFTGQVKRRLAGELTEDEFKPLRLMNGLYLQLHAYMLRVAIPYGTLSGTQMRMLAHVARKYDKGYGHFTTRQNIQYNWPKLKDVPDILADLATVEMHAIQTSGNCIRNVTSDQYAGVAAGEIDDPRVWAEILRQWSTFHPEYTFLPRKFKIAVTGHSNDRAAIKMHDVGIIIVEGDNGEPAFDIYAGGGQGRTPMVAHLVGQKIPARDLLHFMDAIMRVYNMHGRRDNLYKARIKILVHALGAEEFARQVKEEFAKGGAGEDLKLPDGEIERIRAYFAPPAYETLSDSDAGYEKALAEDKAFAQWARTNLADHKVPGYSIVNVSLKPIGGIAGDASDAQMDAVADLAETYSFDEVRVTHEQNLTLPDVKKSDLYEVWKRLDAALLATPNIGLISDMIVCPGLDYCDLANARSISIGQMISERFADLDQEHDIGELKVKISGCINACGHHHVGHIGILGVDKKGVEFYQVTLGGSADENAAVGDIVGPAFTEDEIVGAIETIVETFVANRKDGEIFLDTYRRIGIDPFKETLYAAA